MQPVKLVFVLFVILSGLVSFAGENEFSENINPSESDFPNYYIKFSRLGLEDGLSQSVVLDITQDPQGFMWFATQDGLNRYDGYNFKVFRNNPNDSASVGDNWITDLLVESDSTMLVGTKRAGLYRLNLFDYKFHKIHYEKRGEGGNDYIHDVQLEGNGKIWIATWGNGVYFYDETTNARKHLGEKDGLTSDFVSSILISREKKTLWIGTGLGLDSLNLSNFALTEINFDGCIKRNFEDNFCISLYETEDRTLFIGTQGGLKIKEKSKPLIKCYRASLKNESSLPSDVINQILEDERGYLWFATLDGGIARTRKTTKSKSFDVENLKFVSYKNESTNPFSISANYVRTIFEDASENIWLGTWGAGVSKFDAKPRKFNLVSNYLSGKKILPANSVSCFVDISDNKLLIGTDGGGAALWERKKNRFTNISFEATGNSVKVKLFYKDKSNRIWAATGSGLFQWNEKGKIFLKKNARKGDLNLSSTIYGISEFNGFLFLSTPQGLAFYNPQNGLISPLSLKFDEGNYRFNYILKKSKNEFWIGSTNAFVSRIKLTLDNKGFPVVNEFKNYSALISARRKRGLARVNHLFEASDNVLGISTSGGLCKFASPYDSVAVYDAASGLPNDIVYSACEDNAGFIWISTNNGLTKIAFQEGKINIRNYNVSDGLQSNEFNQSAQYKNRNGELFFGGIKGFNYFTPEKMKDNPHKPKIALTEIKILNKKISNLNEVLRRKRLQVDYSQKMLSFVFASLEFTNPSQNRYSFKLKGFNEEWVNNGRERTAVFTNLDPGEYELFAKASNNDGLWSEPKKILAIEVLPPFWMTWQFKLLVVLFVLFIIWLIYYNRIRYLLKIESLRLKIASDLHDEVGSLLTQISINAELLPYLEDKKETGNKIQLIREKSAEVIKIMSDVIWAIDSRNDSLESLIERVHQFAYSFLKQKGIRLKFSNEIKNASHKLNIEVRQNIMLIAKEAVNNAVKHSGCDVIEISFKEERGIFTMIIKDNGKGLPEEMPERGNGLKNMKMRAELIKAQIGFVNENGLKIWLSLKI